jgi:hypothetical protein
MAPMTKCVACGADVARNAKVCPKCGEVKPGQPYWVFPFGFQLGDDGELVPHEAEQEAIREMIALRAQRKALRAIAEAMQAKGHRISHEGVAAVLRTARAA